VSAAPVVGGLLVVYALFSYYAVLGIPGVPYPRTFARAAGWPQATDALREVSDRIERETGAAPVVVGMDKYNIASQVSYFGARDVAATGRSPLRATTIRELSGSRLMFTFWDPPGQFRDSTLIMVAPRPEILATERLAPHFSHLDQEIHPLPLSASWPAGNGRPIDEYHYRIGYGYRPRE
jgi:dolichol-phosphate mannosyltransferase